MRLAVVNIHKYGQYQTHITHLLSLTALWLVVCSFVWLLSCQSAHAADDDEEPLLRLQVSEPFIELRTGPGRGFPIFHIVERHDWIDVLKRRTDWFRIRTRDNKEGWAYIDQLEQTLSLPGKQTKFAAANMTDFTTRNFEFGVSGGLFETASLMSVYVGYNLSKNLMAEATASQVIGSYTNTILLDASLVSAPFPDWKISPFFTIGAGKFNSTAKSNAINTQTIDQSTAFAGIGVRWYLTRRFVLRADVREYTAFLGEDYNGEFREWKAGFSFFY